MINYTKFIFPAIVGILIFFLLNTCNSLHYQKELNEQQKIAYDQNVKALTDTIEKRFNKKLDAYEFSKNTLLLNKLKDLEKTNAELYNELKKVKGDLIAVIQSDIEVDVPSFSANNLLSYPDQKYGLIFNHLYKDEGLTNIIEGEARFKAVAIDNQVRLTADSTFIRKNQFQVGITYGFRELANQFQVFAIPKSNKVIFNDLEGGYFIDKQPLPKPLKEKKWGVGPYIGVGLSTDFKPVTTFGIGLTYNIIKF